MELGTTKELDTVGENAFACAYSLQRIDSLRSTLARRVFLIAVTKPKNKAPQLSPSFALRQS